MSRLSETLHPLILTLELDPLNQSRFERERRLHYPAKLNRIPAHISLFHALPGEHLVEIKALLDKKVSQTPAFNLNIHDLKRLGKGVAYACDSPILSALHKELSAPWGEWLIPQDRQPYRPHIVIQNKTTPEQADALYDRLAKTFRPSTVQAASLLLWHYRGGPWSQAARFPFPQSRAQ